MKYRFIKPIKVTLYNPIESQQIESYVWITESTLRRIILSKDPMNPKAFIESEIKEWASNLGWLVTKIESVETTPQQTHLI